MKSNITLFIDAGAVIKFSTDFNDYEPAFTRWEGVECYGFSPCIYGFEAENVSLIGRGRLDGQGKAWWDELRRKRKAGVNKPESDMEKKVASLNKGYENAGSGGGGRETQFLRPPLVQFVSCKNVLIDGLIHENSPFWNTHIVYCENVTINNTNFKNPYEAPNTDGLDIDSSKNVHISNCNFDVGDDCLCIKSGIDADGRRVGRHTENVTITNCTMVHGHGGVVFGSECAGGVQNVVISNCIFIGTDRGIRIKSRRGRGGFIRDIRASNIIMEDVICPLVFNLYYRCGAKNEDIPILNDKNPRPVDETTPYVKNMHISNITSKRTRSCAGIFLGLPEMPIEGLRLNDIVIEMDKVGERNNPAMDFDFTMMQRGGFFGRNLKDASFKNIRIIGAAESTIELNSSSNIDIDGMEFIDFNKEKPLIKLNDCDSIYIHNCKKPKDANEFLKISGEKSSNIELFGNSKSLDS